ncbi:guanylate cyclase [Elysia marginata]|uniref:guanylate cyclase n=1 Tax=Elysia marginata TaxID=1093978 RepID=A0AAV4J286_9GAST|nr:guanylate cyclase [Elysia marginata]
MALPLSLHKAVIMIAAWGNCAGLLWTAPELLRGPSGPPGGNQKGDVYSFGIICQEVIYRAGVFQIPCASYSPEEIYQRVKTPSQHQAYFRPFLEACDCPCDQLADVIRSCWAEDPSERPDFATLKSLLRKLNKDGDKGTLVDSLLTRMEMYATNLESVVAERTSDYLDQKRRAEELLYSMLPRPVAEQLILGETVKAVSFDQVSIFFSDIVGFTSMSAQCSPMEIVTLLNDLYTTFDSIIGNFDVYKVETIGDAYMVASGLPVPNGKTHAREIARMSLALLRAVDTFVIRHNPGEKLKLRIGIHTALRIHVSEPTKMVLDTFDTFVMELRGQVDMKGKGSLTTYWLIGEVRRATSLSSTTDA